MLFVSMDSGCLPEGIRTASLERPDCHARYPSENLHQQRSKGTRYGTTCGEGFHHPWSSLEPVHIRCVPVWGHSSRRPHAWWSRCEKYIPPRWREAGKSLYIGGEKMSHVWDKWDITFFPFGRTTILNGYETFMGHIGHEFHLAGKGGHKRARWAIYIINEMHGLKIL